VLAGRERTGTQVTRSAWASMNGVGRHRARGESAMSGGGAATMPGWEAPSWLDRTVGGDECQAVTEVAERSATGRTRECPRSTGRSGTDLARRGPAVCETGRAEGQERRCADAWRAGRWSPVRNLRARWARCGGGDRTPSVAA